MSQARKCRDSLDRACSESESLDMSGLHEDEAAEDADREEDEAPDVSEEKDALGNSDQSNDNEDQGEQVRFYVHAKLDEYIVSLLRQVAEAYHR